MSIRPFMSATQMEREDTAVLDIYRFQDVRQERKRGGVTDQPCVAVNNHHASVLGPPHQHPQLASGIAVCFGSRRRRIAWQTFVNPGKFSADYVLLEKRRLLRLSLCRVENSDQDGPDEADQFHIAPPYWLLGLSKLRGDGVAGPSRHRRRRRPCLHPMAWTDLDEGRCAHRFTPERLRPSGRVRGFVLHQ